MIEYIILFLTGCGIVWTIRTTIEQLRRIATALEILTVIMNNRKDSKV